MASKEGSPVVSAKNPSPEKRKGISRKKKSPSQTEVLEKAYAVEKYPCEATRTKLCRDLELTEKQLQIWFTHRRYKDRRDGIDDEELISKARGSKYDHAHHEDARALKKREIDLNSREGEDSEDGHPARVLAEEHYDDEFMDNPNGLDASGGDDEAPKLRAKATLGRKLAAKAPTVPSMPPRKPGPRPKVDASATAERVAILNIERQLGGPLRDDGPPLGFEFDPLPPDAFEHPAWTEAPMTGGGYRDGESENSDRDGRERNKGSGEFQWRNGLVEKKRKMGHFPKPSRGEGVY